MYTKIARSNEDNVQPTPQPLQDNAIILNLETSDITIAKDDPDAEGIIHVPSEDWNHIIQEVQHPDQSFYNELYINVNGIEPIVDRMVNLVGVKYDQTEVIWDNMTLVTQNTQITAIANRPLFVLSFGDSTTTRYSMSFIVPYSNHNETIAANSIYYMFPSANNVTSIDLVDTDNNVWCKITDPSWQDNNRSYVSFLKTDINLVNFSGE